MNNIIANLRRDRPLSWENRLEAADEIFRLREENARLREALKPFAKCIETYPDAKDDYEIGFGGVHDADCKVFIRDFRAAAAAIREGGK